MSSFFAIFNVSNVRKIEFRKDINGLRAIAVLAVVLYHSELPLIKGGWLGVDIFYGISGYLISNIIISELNDGSFTFKHFYQRRAKRILPALFVTLLITIPFAYSFLTLKALDEYFASLIASVFFFGNYYFKNLDFYSAEPAEMIPLLHTWSLGIEEQFYIVFPLFIFITFKFARKLLFFAILLVAAVSIYLSINDQSVEKFYRLEFRLWELLIGALVMILSSNFKIKNLGLFGFFGLLSALFIFDESQINDVEPKLVSLFSLSLILFSNQKNSILTRILNLKLIEKIGLSSFSIYLIHQPLFAFYRSFKLLNWENFIEASTNLDLLEKILLVCASILMGYLSYKFIEKPFISRKSFKPLLVLFLTLALAFVLTKFIFPKKPNADIQALMFPEANTFSINGASCHDRTLKKLCKIDNNSDISIVALGDSSLRAISYWLGNKSKDYGYNYEQITGNGCLFLLGNKAMEGSCPTFNMAEFNSYVSQIHDSYIVVGGRLPLYLSDEEFKNSMTLEPANVKLNVTISIEEVFLIAIEQLVQNGNKIVLLYPIPEQPWDVPLLFNAGFSSGGTVSYPSSVWDQRKAKSYDLLDRINDPNVIKVYPDTAFCNSFVPDQCVGAINNEIFYFDDSHLSLKGGELVANQIFKSIFGELK